MATRNAYYSLTLASAPAVEPLARDTEVKQHLRSTGLGTAEDTFVDGLITTARRWVEHYTWRSLITQTWELRLDDWPEGDRFKIPRPPLQSVTSIGYADKDGTAATLAATEYWADVKSTPGRVALRHDKSWPSVTLKTVGAITVTYVAGYGATGATVPQEAREAMQLLIGHWNENREAALIGSISKELEFSVRALLDPLRVIRFGGLGE